MINETIRRELTGRGRFDIDVARHVAGNMRYVTIRNGRKGLESVEVFVKPPVVPDRPAS